MPSLGPSGSDPQLRAFAAGNVHRADDPVGAALRMIEHPTVPALLAPALCGAAALAAFLLLLGAQRSLDALLRKLRKPAPSPASLAESPEHIPEEAVPPLRTAGPSLVPATEPRAPTDTQRKALHTAALLAIESRSVQSPGAPRILRRSSDYEGPRRRSTDGQPSLFYRGPYRRTTDSAASRSNPSAFAAAQVEDPFEPDPASRKVVCIEPRQLPPKR